MVSPFERAIVSLPHEGEDAGHRGARFHVGHSG
jgi:hypothetical protein